MQKKDYLSISELSRKTGVSLSTIRYYLWEGILPPPLKTAQTRALYTKDHISALMLIRKKQIEEHKSLATIKHEMQSLFKRSGKWQSEQPPLPSRKDTIINSAIELWLTKGANETSIADIVAHAHISKETFYQFFKNKEELFVASADRIFHEMYTDVWQELSDEKDRMVRLQKRLISYFESYKKWIDMINLLRNLAVSENQIYRDKYRQIILNIVGPLINDLKHLQAEGILRTDIDVTLAGYLAMGMAEYAAEYIDQNQAAPEEIVKLAFDLVQYGVKPEKKATSPKKNKQSGKKNIKKINEQQKSTD